MRTAARAQEAMEIVPCENRQRQQVEGSSRRQQQQTAAVEPREVDGWDMRRLAVKVQPRWRWQPRLMCAGMVLKGS